MLSALRPTLDRRHYCSSDLNRKKVFLPAGFFVAATAQHRR